jgi:CubicO group peptidase (beta-lactamase class C family)
MSSQNVSLSASRLFSFIFLSLWASALVAALTVAVPSWADGDSLAKPVQNGESTSRYSAEDEAHFRRRYEQYAVRGAAGSLPSYYDSLAPVGGADEAPPLPRRSASGIPAAALEAARDYAARTGSGAFIIYRDGAVELEYYGEGASRETLFNSKSLAKPLATVAAARAVASGHIESLQQPVSDFLTEWQGRPQEAITLFHVLSNTGGLLGQQAGMPRDHVLNRAYLHPRHIEVILNDYPMTHAPGERYDYSNANMDLVAPIIERATGSRYAAWLEREVLRPLGARGGTIWLNREGGIAHSACCIQLPADTWLRLAILVMRGGVWEGERLIPEGFFRAMVTPTPLNPYFAMQIYVGAEYAQWRGAGNADTDFSKMFHSEPYDDADEMILFDGNGNQVAFMVPSRDLVILRLGHFPPGDMTWDNAYLPNLIARALDDG